MARRSATAEEPAGESLPAPDTVKRYKVTHYKVRTSQGRKIEGQFVELPASEGEAFVKLGHLKNADPQLARRP